MSIKKYIKFLQLTSLFKDFSQEELLKLFNENNHNIYEYEKNTIIHLQNEKCITLDFIISGDLVVQKIDENGKVLTLTEFTKGDIIGGNLILANNNSYPLTIIAKNNAVLLHIKKDFVLDLCQSNKNFLIEFLKCISDKTLILTNKIKSISLKSIRECIVDFLNYESYDQNTYEIKLNMTKKELAERLGIQRTSLSRELNKMKKDGLIEYNSKIIIIKDVSILNK